MAVGWHGLLLYQVSTSDVIPVGFSEVFIGGCSAWGDLLLVDGAKGYLLSIYTETASLVKLYQGFFFA